jgi:hypothetical protein
MNKYGLVLDDVGMEHTMSAFMRDLISPVAKMLYSAFGGSSLDRQHAFVVQYRSGEDLKLDMHTDDSEVRLIPRKCYPGAFLLLTLHLL